VDKDFDKIQSIKRFNKFSISQFAVNLSYENWDNVCIEEEVNTVNTVTTFLTHTWEFLTPASRYRKYTVHIITNIGLQQG